MSKEIAKKESSLLDLGMIYFPSIRGVAYLNAFKAIGVAPKHLLIFAGEIPQLSQLSDDFKKQGYVDSYFDPELSAQKFLIENPQTKSTYLKTRSINDPELFSFLKSSAIRTWCFAGGGIIQKKLFEIGKRFLHVHPGLLPDYRGSTTFYYSYLAEKKLAATAFFMSPEIDSGEILTECEFEINVEISEKNSFFIDSVLDPFLRAETLKVVLKRVKFNGVKLLSGKKGAPATKPPFYIIHPWLRRLMVERLNKQYDPNKETGIFLRQAKVEE